MDQVLVTRKVPKREGCRVGRWVGIRVELKHGIMVGKPGGVRVARIQGRVFQQAQSPAMPRIRSATTPILAVVRMAAQVFPSQRRTIQVQDVKIGRRRIPGRGAGISHGATSLGSRYVATADRRAMERSSKRHEGNDKLSASRPIGSGAFLVSSECDDGSPQNGVPYWPACQKPRRAS